MPDYLSPVRFVPGAAPAAPQDGMIWYDTKFKKREGGVTSDMDTTGAGASGPSLGKILPAAIGYFSQ